MKIYKLFARFMKPAGEDTSTGGTATTDRGDDFEPTGDDAPPTKDTLTDEEAEAERAKLGLAAGKTKEADPATKTEEGKDPVTDPKKDSRIPLARHTEILNRERAAREQAEADLAALRKTQAVATTNVAVSALETKLADLEEKHTAAITEGDTKTAQTLMKEIRMTERSVIEQQAEIRTQQATATAVEQVRLDATIERLEMAYPQLKHGSETFDQALVGEILDLKEAFQLKGLSPSAALQKAVGYVVKPETAKQEAATTVTPRVTADAAAAAVTKAEREAAARKRGVETANAQPPALGKDGANSDEAGGALDAKQAIKMPFEKFTKISDEELSRMRGDTV